VLTLFCRLSLHLYCRARAFRARLELDPELEPGLIINEPSSNSLGSGSARLVYTPSCEHVGLELEPGPIINEPSSNSLGSGSARLVYTPSCEPRLMKRRSLCEHVKNKKK
jgi:hypothetical protein